MKKLSDRISQLSPVKQALLQSLIQPKQNSTSQVIPRLKKGIAPLSFAQQRLWFLEQLDGGHASYNIPTALKITGSLDVATLEQAIAEIVQRHESLRTTFPMARSPHQVIAANLTVTLQVYDLQELPEANQSAEVRRLVTSETQRLFDLAKGPLLRVALLRLESESHLLLLTMHHIISDGWSIGIFIRELSSLYDAFSPLGHKPTGGLPELPIQYADFAHWQRAQGVSEKQLNYWKQQLAGAPPLTQLPTDRPRPKEKSFRGGVHLIRLHPDLTRRLKRLSVKSGATLFMTLLAAFGTLLSRVSDQEDILVGSPIANRNISEIESIIGFFVNTLVLRIQLQGNPTFSELLSRVRQVALDAYAHQDVPFEQLVEALQPERKLSHSPLFQVMFVWQNAPLGRVSGKLTLTPVVLEMESVTAKFDLTLSMQEEEQGLQGLLEYNSDLFDVATIQRMAGHFQTLLEAIVNNPQQRVSELPLLTARERDQLLVEWNDTGLALSLTETEEPPHCIHEWVEEQVEESPDAVAVVCGEMQLTYWELNQRANQLAHHLIKRGVGPEVLVGLHVERSLDMVVGVLGILKAGGAYVPLDPSLPKERIGFMLSDSEIRVLLTQEKLVAGLPEHDAHVVCLDTEWAFGESKENPISGVQPENLAYVIYTSGSTGQPKGVLVAHQGLCNLTEAHIRTFDMQRDSRLFQFVSLSFDAATSDLFMALCSGATLVLACQARVVGPELIQQLRDQAITHMALPPSVLSLLTFERLPALRVIFTGGESCTTDLVAKCATTNRRFFNAYGPTEATISATIAECNKQEVPSIGRPIANTQIYILDRHLQPVPVGVLGELHIGGVGLARGYLNRPELTAEKFIPNPFLKGGLEEGSRLYKSGDLARYRPDGQIEFIDRIDNQVKIRGFRIELGEIEATLRQHPDVQATVVLVRADQGNKHLVAYVVCSKADANSPALGNYLADRLPEYMVPSIVLLDQMPLLPSGKVDRRALPAPKRNLLSTSFVAPRSPIEEVLAANWADLLGLKDKYVGIHDNFFELGGHSLLATQVISRLREAFSVELPLRRLFESPTVGELSELIAKARRSNSSPVPPIQPVAHEGEAPLSFGQRQLWFMEQLSGVGATYNIPAAFSLRGPLQIAALSQSLTEIVRRHEVLRTTFPTRNGVPRQVIASAPSVSLPVVDLGHLPEVEQEAQVQRLALDSAQRPFDLANGPLLRVTLLQLNKESHVLLLTMHHIVTDGWSMGVFIRELLTLYEAYVKEGAGELLPSLPIQYADFAHWQRQWLSGEVLSSLISYWKQTLEGAPTLKLPTDHARPARQTFQGATESFVLPNALSESLKLLSRQEGSTLFMSLFATFQILLRYYTGQDDIMVGTDVANRNQAAVEGLIGLFVNQLVLRTDLSGNPTFRELLGRVRQVALEAYAHQELPFDMLVTALKVERDLSRTPLFQVKFVLQNAAMPALSVSDLTLSLLEVDNGTAKFDLLLNIWNTEQGLVGAMQYRTDLFEATTMARMVEHFKTLLRHLVTQPDSRLKALEEILTDADRQQQLLKEKELQDVSRQRFLKRKVRRRYN